MPSSRRGDREHATLLFCARECRIRQRGKRKRRLKQKQVPDTSTTLLRDVADSNHARWSVFYSRYQPMMLSYLRSRFPSLDAEDIVQETFVALAKILPDYKYAPEKNGAFHNFLTGVLRNKALKALAARQRDATLKENAALEMGNDISASEVEYETWRESVYEIALQQLLADEASVCASDD